MATLSETLIDRLEQAEAEAWIDVCEADAIRTDGFGWAAWLTEDATIFCAPRSNVLFHNRAIGLWDERADEAAIDRVVDLFRTARAPRFFVHVSPRAEARGLPEALAERGFEHHNDWLKLFRTVDDPPEEEPGAHITRLPSRLGPRYGLDVTRAFDWPIGLAETIAATPDRPGWKVYVAWIDTEPVAYGGLYVCGGSAYLGPAFTRPEFRGRGAQTALIKHRIREAARHGCALLVTETADDTPEKPNPSTKNLVSAGFEVAYRRANWRMDLAVR
jgi:GNAT superfamily N-acetyltransferase